jgi:HTH-type transcriptional repressor of NAD biosynthesis genes
MSDDVAAEGVPPAHRLGVTIGKFYPFTRGHLLLVTKAKEQCEHLVVIVTERDGDAVGGATRANWIRECLSDPDGVEVIDTPDNVAEAPGPWAERTLQLLAPRRPDVAFTCEAYGDSWAAGMGCSHVHIDPRITTATEVRSDLSANWGWLTGPAKAFFCKRVVVLGVESSGTTTLAQGLAEHYRTAWVPEYGRSYWEGRQSTSQSESDWETFEFVRIARGQQQTEDDLAHRANRVLVLDTDALATTLWHRRFTGRVSAAVERVAGARSYALYILTTPDFPFVQDGTREGEAIRHEMHGWFEEALAARAPCTPYIVVRGSHEERLKAAIAAIDPLLMFPQLPLRPKEL